MITKLEGCVDNANDSSEKDDSLLRNITKEVRKQAIESFEENDKLQAKVEELEKEVKNQAQIN